MTPVRRLDEVALVFNGKTPSKAEQRANGHPVLKIKDVTDDGLFKGIFESFVERALAAKHKGRWIRTGDTLILNAAHNAAYVGSKIFNATEDVAGALATGEWLVVRPNDAVALPAYVSYWLRSPETKKQIAFLVKGIHLYPKDVATLHIPLPPLNEQRRIVDLLARAEGIVRLRREAQNKAAEIIPALFLDMFGDPATNPKGWEVAPLGDLCARITDGTHQPPKFVNEGIPFVFVANIVSGTLNFETEKFISETTYCDLTRRCPIERGDVLYSTVGSYGVPVKVDTDRRFCFQRHIAHLKPQRDRLDSDFLVGMLFTPALRRQADAAARGIAQKTINLGEIRKFRVIAPPLGQQKGFATQVAAARAIQALQAAAATKAKAAFDGMLSRVFMPDSTLSDTLTVANAV